ncbi:MAG: RecX family transcriptional regulator [Clostridia bacterium]|nr:RecX family transcriptional regulator [Clostridia bacterium]MDD4686004.1 RecX family transcriptional regulator [Clostridia bacterium]
MQITEFKKIGKTCKYKIFVDNQFFGLLTDETIIKYNLKINQEYEFTFLKQVLEDGQKKLALNMALSLLNRQQKTEKEAREYLKRKQFVDKAIDYAVEKMKEYNYINDENYAKTYINSKRDNKGKKAIAYDLKLKGIDSEIIKINLELVKSQRESIYNLAQKIKKNKANDLKLRDKLFRSLASKGFEFDEINSVLNEILK